MNVLMFGWEFPPHISGGLGTACFGITRGLCKQGVKVQFVVPKAYGDEDQSYAQLVNASDVEVNLLDEELNEYWKNFSYIEAQSHIIPYTNLGEYYDLIHSKNEKSEEILYDFRKRTYKFGGKYGDNLLEEVSKYALVASSVAKEREFDVIHAHDWLTYKAGIAAKAISGKPLVIHVHATEFDRSGENVNQQVYDLEREGMHAADKIIAVSYYTRQIVINKYGVNPDKVVAIHNAIDKLNKEREAYKKNVPEKVVTFLGRVTFQKGPDYFIEAANKILKKDDNVRFVMAGSGDMLRKSIKRVAELKIADKFHFTGFLKGADVIRMYSISDVYVMPSVSEPFGISPLEAIRSNVPVVISKQSGVSEILNHALKVDFWDIDAMADAIYGLLHYNSLSKMFVSLAKEEVDSFKWENAGFKMKKLYEEVI